MNTPPLNSSPRFRELLAGRTPLLVALGAIVIGLCLLVVFAALLLRGGDVAEVIDEEPTPFPTAATVATNDVIVAGLSGSTPISLSLNAPTTLEVAGARFTVRPEPVEQDGTWEPEPGEGEIALWVYGSLINYILGLPDSSENRALLEGLAPGADIYLTLRDGTRHTFAVTNRESVGTNRTDIFEQQLPGITLILLQARGDERLVVKGDYVVDTSTGSNAPATVGNQVELGETAQMDGLRLAVTGATSLFDRPEALAGFIFYIADLQLENVGVVPIDLDRLRFVLRDDLGNQYALNTPGSNLGNYPPPTGALAPGETQQVSLAYQIPNSLSSATLTLLISREGGSGEVQVTIPFAGGDTEAAATATITVDTAEISEDGTSILLAGQLTNNASQPLLVDEGDVSLISNGTVHLLLATNPAFPWVTPPGQTIPFTVSFQRPAGADAIFTLLNQPFQLTGLR